MPGQQEDRRARRRARRQARATWALAILGFFVLAGAALIGGGLWVYQSAQDPVDPADAEERIVIIPAGAHSGRIAGILHDHGLIHSPLVFQAVVRFQELDGSLKAGEYAFSRSMDLSEIIGKMVAGEIVTHPFSVPEGLTVNEIIQLLDRNGVARADDLRRAVDEAAASWPYLPDGGEGLPEPLEGYLLPETYHIPSGTTAASIVAIMLGQFEKVFAPAWRERAEELGLTVHEAVTLASIVEKEARLAEEREIIAGVFHNRLNIGMKLDADPTVAYAVSWDDHRPDGPLTLRDLEYESPFNTYVTGGLPPGPIASPGRASIEAALYPADVNYLFFVSKFDGTGAHVFAETYDEHRQNVRKYRDGL